MIQFKVSKQYWNAYFFQIIDILTILYTVKTYIQLTNAQDPRKVSVIIPQQFIFIR